MKKIFFYFFIGFFLAVVIFFIYDKNRTILSSNDSPVIKINNEYPLLNPKASSKNTKPENIEKAQAEISTFLEDDETVVAYYFRDLNNGPWVFYNGQYRFEGASLNKVPIMITFLKATENYPELLQEKVLYDQDLKENDEEFSRSLILGESYTLEELIEAMIINSDNTSYQLLEKYAIENNLDPNIYDTFEYLGMDKDENFVTVTQYSTILRVLYNAEYLNMEMSSKALDILLRTKFEEGLVKNLPEEIEVAHKYGVRWFTDSNEKQIHDCGIIYKGERPYILCVMTRGTSIPKQEKIIANISKIIFELLNN